MTFATIDDLLEVDPNIQDYGVLDFEAALASAEQDLVKLLKIRWWPSFIKDQTFPSGVTRPYILNSDLLNPSQWTQTTCYLALAHYIFPKMSKFDSDTDSFQHKMEYFAQRAETTLDMEIRSGVQYDIDQDDQFSTTETQPVTSLRLIR
jgi:hypothetical protein